MLQPVPEKILPYLAAHVSPARYQHILGTWKVARGLADAHGMSQRKVMLAALLHDAGKCMPSDAMIRYAERYRLQVPAKAGVVKFNPSLLHSYISAHIARTVFGIHDADVLEAIRCHTVGCAKMSTLSKILYLADATAPDRRRPGVKQLRWLAHRNLDKAMLMAVGEKAQYVLLKKKWMHPLATEAWNYFYTLYRFEDNA